MLKKIRLVCNAMIFACALLLIEKKGFDVFPIILLLFAVTSTAEIFIKTRKEKRNGN